MREKFSKLSKSKTKSKLYFLPPYFKFNIYADTAFFCFANHILKLKARDQSKRARKKLFCHVAIKNYLCNVLCKFLIKVESR